MSEPEAVIRELAEITEQLVSGGYDGTEGESGSRDTTWTDFGIVYGIADALAAEVRQLREALEDFANPQHWAIRRHEFEVPSFVWIGTYAVTPIDHARAVLDSKPPSGEDTSPPRGALSSPNA